MSFGSGAVRGTDRTGPGNEAASSHGGATRPRRRVVEDSPRASEGSPPRSRGRTLRAARGGSDAGAVRGSPRGEGPHTHRFRHSTPTGGGAGAVTRESARSPRGEGPANTRHSGRGPIARGDDEASKRIIHAPPALGDPFDKTSRSGSRPSPSVSAICLLYEVWRFRPWHNCDSESTS